MKKKRILYVVFFVYIAILLKLTIFRSTTMVQRAANFRLFADLIDVYKTATTWQFVRLFFGNIGWFAPWGFMLSLLAKRKNLWLTVLTGLGFSFLIEITQYIFRKGFFEIDDLILNTLGAVIGYGIFRLVCYVKERLV